MAARRVSLGEKMKKGLGADVYFENTSGTSPDPDTETAMDKSTDTNTSPDTDTGTVMITDTNTGTGTGTYTGTSALLDQLIKPSENYIRHVCYLNNEQSKFVKSVAKKKRVKESEVFRIAIDYLMKSMNK